jgi:hypothetical protein
MLNVHTLPYPTAQTSNLPLSPTQVTQALLLLPISLVMMYPSYAIIIFHIII